MNETEKESTNESSDKSADESTKSEKYSLGFHPFLFFFGYSVLSCEADELPTLINLCRALKINYRTLKEKKSGKRAVWIPFFSASKLVRAAEGKVPSLKCVKCGGLPALLQKNKARVGVFLGLVCSIIAIIWSQTVIWDIRIDGNDRVSDSEIIEILGECGLSLGVKKSGISTVKLENSVLILSDDIAWISVNIVGCVAEVNVKEIDFMTEEKQTGDASNVIANVGGTVVGFEDIRGNISVHIGDEVSKGQLLIGGIYGDEENGFRYTNAKGKVLAQVERTFSVSVPRNFLKKRYTEVQKCEKYLIFFKNKIKFFGNCGNLHTNYDKIEIEEYLPVSNGKKLPVGILTLAYSEYVYEETKRSDEELLHIAKYKLDADVSHTLQDAELLSKKESVKIDDSGITLTCTVRAIENIAKIQEIEIVK